MVLELVKVKCLCLIIASFILLSCTVSSSAQEYLDSVPGEVISYIESPTRLFGIAWNPVYISDPSIVVLPNGDYIASHARFGWGSNSSDYGETSVFRSSDQGQNWTHLTTLEGILRASLFVHNSDLYLLGTYNEGGQNVIRKSTDNGSNWTDAVDSQTGLLGAGGLGTPNNPVVLYNRIWSGATRRLFSAPVNADLLKASSWTITNWPSESGHPFGDDWQGWTEGQAVASPLTGVYVLPKIRALPHTALIQATSSASVSFDASAVDAFPSLPGGEKKFGASYDPVSGRFYVLSNPVLDVHAGGSTPPELVRTAAGILSSKDLIHWDLEKIFLFTENLDNGDFGEGFQYFNFDIDNEDMIIVSRTAFDVGGGQRKPPRGHDTNLLTFHRINNFRNASPEHLLVIDSVNDNLLRYEITQHQTAPLGSFMLGHTFEGEPLSQPSAIAQDPNGDIYIRQQNGKILRFDALGNFINTPNQVPVTFQAEPLLISQPDYGERAWRVNGSADWHDLKNWYYWGRPDTDYEIANMGSAVNTPATITMNQAYILKGIRFRNNHTYTIEGLGNISLKADNDQSIVEVYRGNHEIAVPVKLYSNTVTDVEGDAELHFTNELNLNGRELFIQGNGKVYIDDFFIMNSGKLVLDGRKTLKFAQGCEPVINGTLIFSPHESNSLKLGETFTLLEDVSYLNGQFTDVNLPDLPQGLIWDTSMLYNNGKVTVVPDYSVLDFFNFSHIAHCWLTDDCLQQPGCSYADLNQDNVVNIFDIGILSEYWLEELQ